MRFHHLDLNLLVALDVLLEEQNITRAAARLHMTQSATSGVLGRLRAYFADDLLVQVGRKMMPTPLAKELELPVREVLLTIQSSIVAKPAHDPANSNRHFRVAASDYVISVMLSKALQQIAEQAPHITFEMLAFGDTAFDLLTRGAVELLIIPGLYLTEDHPSHLLFEEEHVCAVWSGNTAVGERISMEQYLEMGHITVGLGHNRRTTIEDWFISQYNCKRRLEVITHDFNTLPQLLVGTQRIVTMHRRLAEQYAQHYPLRIIPTPVPLPIMQEHLVWHRSMDRDPMLRWVREQFVKSAQAMTSSVPYDITMQSLALSEEPVRTQPLCNA